MPKVSDFYESYRANEFVLVIDGTESPGVSKISGLTTHDVPVQEQPDGGSNHVYKIAGTTVRYEALTIERHVDGGPEDQRFQDWIEETFKLNQPLQGRSAIRKNGMIIKRHNGEQVLAFAFYDAWLQKASFSDLEAGSTNLFTQTIVLEHEGLERVQ